MYTQVTSLCFDPKRLTLFWDTRIGEIRSFLNGAENNLFSNWTVKLLWVCINYPLVLLTSWICVLKWYQTYTYFFTDKPLCRLHSWFDAISPLLGGKVVHYNGIFHFLNMDVMTPKWRYFIGCKIFSCGADQVQNSLSVKPAKNLMLMILLYENDPRHLMWDILELNCTYLIPPKKLCARSKKAV